MNISSSLNCPCPATLHLHATTARQPTKRKNLMVCDAEKLISVDFVLGEFNSGLFALNYWSDCKKCEVVRGIS